jgi:hypothetical protein
MLHIGKQKYLYNSEITFKFSSMQLEIYRAFPLCRDSETVPYTPAAASLGLQT